MFDIGFWELALIGVVALLVIGPERLPGVARKTGLWVGKMRRFVATVKADVDRELAADELKKTLAKQMETPELYEIIEETKETLQSVKENVSTGAAQPSPSIESGDSAATLSEPAQAASTIEPAADPVAKKSHDTGG